MNTASLYEMGKWTEEQAREHLESIRWPNGPACPRCGDMNVSRSKGKSVRRGLLNCRGCRKPFTVTVGTIFEDSHVPLTKWLLAFHKVCSSKKSISAHQLMRDLGLGSYRTAWHMAHRIRHAMQSEPLRSQLEKLYGVVECDETYVGGRPRKGSPTPKADRKTPVFVAVERGGRARVESLPLANAWQAKRFLSRYVARSAALHTDDSVIYRPVGKQYGGGHHTTQHLHGEYARGLVHSNTAESFFSLVKRGFYGTYHRVSRKHLDRYLGEYGFRWNYRKVTDAERRDAALRCAEGQRLMYRTLVGREKVGA